MTVYEFDLETFRRISKQAALALRDGNEMLVRLCLVQLKKIHDELTAMESGVVGVMR